MDEHLDELKAIFRTLNEIPFVGLTAVGKGYAVMVYLNQLIEKIEKESNAPAEEKPEE